jgi:hypothetical protein
MAITLAVLVQADFPADALQETVPLLSVKHASSKLAYEDTYVILRLLTARRPCQVWQPWVYISGYLFLMVSSPIPSFALGFHI